MTITRFPAPTVNSNGHLNVVQHGHPDSVFAHLDLAATGGTGYNIILVDLSDTTSYPHLSTNYIHLEELFIGIDAETNADYNVVLGFLQNVDGTDGDFYELTHVSGTKTVGQQKEVVRKFYPNGAKCQDGLMITSDITLNDTTFNTATNLASILDPSTADTPSGDGDLVLAVTSTGGANSNFNIEINFAYHTHA